MNLANLKYNKSIETDNGVMENTRILKKSYALY